MLFYKRGAPQDAHNPLPMDIAGQTTSQARLELYCWRAELLRYSEEAPEAHSTCSLPALLTQDANFGVRVTNPFPIYAATVAAASCKGICSDKKDCMIFSNWNQTT